MYRKIHSSNDSEASFASELKREFGRYFKRPRFYCTYVLNKYPLTFFSIMVFSILLSGILSFTVMRIEKPISPLSFPKSVSSDSNGLSEVMGAVGTLKETAVLQSRIEVLARKDRLNAADSIEVYQTIKRIDEIRKAKKLKPKP